MSNRTYTVDELKIALKGAGLPDYVRRTVYLSLPPAPEPPAPPLLCSPGMLVYRREGTRIVEAGIVAGCSTDRARREQQQITVWYKDGNKYDSREYRYGDLCTIHGDVYTGVE